MMRKPKWSEEEIGKIPWKVIAINRPGYGKSSLGKVRPDQWVYKDLADDVRDLMDTLKVDKFALVGGSSGGPCCLAVAGHLQTRITAIWLISADANYCASENYPATGKKLHAKYQDPAEITYMDAFSGMRPDVCCGKYCGPASAFCQMCCCCPKGLAVDLHVEKKSVDYELTDIKCPVYIIHGETEDVDVNCAHFHGYRLPNVKRKEIVPKMAHCQVPGDIYDKWLNDDLRAAALEYEKAGCVFEPPAQKKMD